MAFAFVAVAHYDSSSSNSAVVAKPTGTADNDILFALIKHNANEDVASVPSGWAQLGLRRYGSAASVSLYWKLAASEGSDYTFGFTTAARLAVSVVAYRDGFDTADPIDVVSDTPYVTNDTTLRAASMSVTATDSPIIFLGSTIISTSHTFTPPTVPDTFTEDVDYWETNSRGGRSISHLAWASSGATGNMDATISTSMAAVKHAYAVALNPAAAGASRVHLLAGKLGFPLTGKI